MNCLARMKYFKKTKKDFFLNSFDALLNHVKEKQYGDDYFAYIPSYAYVYRKQIDWDYAKKSDVISVRYLEISSRHDIPDVLHIYRSDVERYCNSNFYSNFTFLLLSLSLQHVRRTQGFIHYLSYRHVHLQIHQIKIHQKICKVK